ncbi:hypothetical protein ACFL54_04435 [Planctomycetota bacterium]
MVIPFIYFIAGVVIVVILMVGPRLYVRRRGVFNTGNPNLQLQMDSRIKAKTESMIVELQEINREVVSRLDNKIRMLDLTISQAEKSIRELKDLNLETEKHMAGLKKAMETAVISSTKEPGKDTTEAAVGELGEAEIKSLDQASKVINSQYEYIYTLSDEGRDSLAIAEETGMQRGEIDFILRLRPIAKS